MGDKEGDEEKEEDMDLIRYTGRTASGMIKDMFNPHAVSSPGKTIPHSPSTSTSSASNDSMFASPERTSSCSDSSHHRVSSWRIPQEMYECQEELVGVGETLSSGEEAEEEEDDDGSSSLSSPKHGRSSVPSNSSDGGTSSCRESMLCKSEGGARNGLLSHGQSMIFIGSPSKRSKKKGFGRRISSEEENVSPDRFLQNFNPKSKKPQKPVDPGYFTFRRPNKSKSKGKKTAHRFSMKPQKLASMAAEISSPSSVVVKSNVPFPSLPSGEGTTSLTRHSAFRNKRGTRINQAFSDTIPEASYTLEMTMVPVIFKTTKMEVPCRGEGWVSGLVEARGRPVGLATNSNSGVSEAKMEWGG